MERQHHSDGLQSFILSDYYNKLPDPDLIKKGKIDSLPFGTFRNISVTIRFTTEFLMYMGTYPKYSLTILAARTINVRIFCF